MKRQVRADVENASLEKKEMAKFQLERDSQYFKNKILAFIYTFSDSYRNCLKLLFVVNY